MGRADCASARGIAFHSDSEAENQLRSIAVCHRFLPARAFCCLRLGSICEQHGVVSSVERPPACPSRDVGPSSSLIDEVVPAVPPLRVKACLVVPSVSSEPL